MSWPDLVNGSFEFCGIFFLLTSILKLHHDKQIRGVHWLHITYFFIWALWNMYWYPYLGQWFSFWGGVAMLIANGYWLGQMIYYTRLERAAENAWWNFIVSGNDPTAFHGMGDTSDERTHRD